MVTVCVPKQRWSIPWAERLGVAVAPGENLRKILFESIFLDFLIFCQKIKNKVIRLPRGKLANSRAPVRSSRAHWPVLHHAYLDPVRRAHPRLLRPFCALEVRGG